MSGLPLSPRWGGPGLAAAYYTLRDSCAPQLGGLVYNAALPDAQLAKILAWADTLMAVDPDPALGLEALAEVFPALVVAVVASYSYANPAPSGDTADIVMTDRGTGKLVSSTLGAAMELASGLHGAAGEDLTRRTSGDLARKIEQVAMMVARRE